MIVWDGSTLGCRPLAAYLPKQAGCQRRVQPVHLAARRLGCFCFYKNNDTAQYKSSNAMTKLTAFVCRAKNLQKAEPNSAQT